MENYTPPDEPIDPLTDFLISEDPLKEAGARQEQPKRHRRLPPSVRRCCAHPGETEYDGDYEVGTDGMGGFAEW